MGNFKSEAEQYEPKTQKNIAELNSVEISNAVITEDRIASNGDAYTTRYVVINKEEYRVPESVLGQLKEVLKNKPALKTFKVTRTGQGLNTKYQVIPLD